jgi:phosphoglycolate phosphatase-like HAD superfamily hydrolase
MQRPHRLLARGGARLRGVVLDVDGTLTMPHAIDFAAMRRRVGAPRGVDMLAHVAAQPEAERAALHAAIADEEEQGLARARPAPHAAELFAFLARRGLPRALLTRNNESVLRRTVDVVLAPLLPLPAAGGSGDSGSGEAPGPGPPSPFFYPMLSRSFERPKPHPDALLHIAACWSLEASELAMVGDSEDDLLCARAAGAAAVLVGNASSLGEAAFAAAAPFADVVVDDLRALAALLETLSEGAPEATS